MIDPDLSSCGSLDRFRHLTKTLPSGEGLPRVAAIAMPVSCPIILSMSPIGVLGSELSLQQTCVSASGGNVKVRTTWTFLARSQPVLSVHGMGMPFITNRPLSQATEQSCSLRKLMPSMPSSEILLTRKSASNFVFRSLPSRRMLP